MAESIAKGQGELFAWPQQLRLEVVEAMNIASDSGVGLLPGIKLLQEALQILGNKDEVLIACRTWKEKRTNQSIVPRPVDNAV